MQLKNLMHHNQHCYRFEYLSFIKSSVNSMSDELLDNNTIFDSFVYATYIITMEENGRVNNIRALLSKYIPTSNIYIVYNKGFKKCNKTLPQQITYYDLTDAYINIFIHSAEKKYNNILILEDDFIFDKKILNRNIINEIKNFFEENKNKIFCFNLGPLPFLFNRNIHNNIYRCNDCLGSTSSSSWVDVSASRRMESSLSNATGSKRSANKASVANSSITPGCRIK